MAKRLTEKQKSEIAEYFKNGKTIEALSEKFNCTNLTITRNLKKNLGEKIYKELSNAESQEHILEEMQTRDELYDYLSYHKYEKEMDDILNKKDE